MNLTDIIDDLSATPASTYGLLQHDHTPKQAYIDLAEFIENPAPVPAP